MNQQHLKRDLALIRAKSPLVHNITNYVAMNFSANALLAIGASPVMAHAVEEMEDMVGIASALVINIGTLDAEWVKGMLTAGRSAHRLGKPIVLDPVGVGATPYRTQTAWQIIRECHPTIIRGNASEIMALVNADIKSKGVDSSQSSDDAVESAKQLAKTTGAVVVISGATDYITDGTRVETITNGSPLMTQVTAMGCTASSIVGAFAGINPDPFEASLHGMALMGICGERAVAKKASPGSLMINFIDELASPNPSQGGEFKGAMFESPLLGRGRGEAPSFDLSLYLVTDRTLAQGRDMSWIVREAVAGGVTMVQLREKECSTAEFVALARELKTVLQPLGIPLIINDRIDVALAVNADGVHIGQSDMPYDTARALLGKEKIIGLSVETIEEVMAANALDVDYIGISPVYATPTKTDTLTPFGLEGIEEVMRLSRHRCVAIGGMNRDTIGEVIARGIEGVAVVSAIVAADSPRQASAELVGIIQKNRSEHHKNNFQLSILNSQFKKVLTIAGSDSGGGAGIQADIKSISANGCFATSAITAITAQNTLGVNAIERLSVDIIEKQIDAVLSDIGADCVKIGMLHSTEVVHCVARMLRKYGVTDIVLDPVMISTSGHKLLEDSAIEALKSELIPMARVITPNIPEAEVLLGESISKQDELPDAARRLAEKYGVSVLLKAGHLIDDELIDIFYNRESGETIALRARHIDTRNTHGTGCTLSSAFAAQLAKGFSLTEAARAAKHYINQAIVHGARYEIGHGHGPVAHFIKL